MTNAAEFRAAKARKKYIELEPGRVVVNFYSDFAIRPVDLESRTPDVLKEFADKDAALAFEEDCYQRRGELKKELRRIPKSQLEMESKQMPPTPTSDEQQSHSHNVTCKGFQEAEDRAAKRKKILEGKIDVSTMDLHGPPAQLCRRLRTKSAACASNADCNGVSQTAAVSHVRILPGIFVASDNGIVNEDVSSAACTSQDKPKALLLQLKRPHYNAIMAGRKLWEARPLLTGSGQPTIYNKLAIVSNVAILQSGAGTNDRVRIAEVRRYTPQNCLHPLEDMVAELGTDLLPDVADIRSRAVVYEELYGFQRCAGGFVAMRLVWPRCNDLRTRASSSCGD